MPSTTRFQTLLGFSSDDLAANRHGELSPAQLARLKKSARSSSLGCLAILAFFFVVALAMLLVFSNALNTLPNDEIPIDIGAIAGQVVPGFFCLLFGIMILITLRSVLFPQTPTLGRTTGPVMLGNTTSDHASHEIEINGQPFEVPQAVYELLDASKTYTLYTAVYNRGGLSVYSTKDDHQIVALEEVRAADKPNDKSPMDYEKEQLQTIFHFTDADLEANRHGELTTEQSAYLRRNLGNGVPAGIFLGGFVGVFVLIFVGAFSQNFVLTVILTAAVFLAILYLNIRGAERQQRKLDQSLRSGVVNLRGQAAVRISKVHHRSGKSSYTETLYHIKFGDKEFTVNEETYLAFKEGREYSVYYVPSLNSQPIVAAERIG